PLHDDLPISDGSNMASMALTCAILAAPVMESVIRLLYRVRHGKRTRNAQNLLIFHIIILEYLSKSIREFRKLTRPFKCVARQRIFILASNEQLRQPSR